MSRQAVDATAMTLDEALLIRGQARIGALDLRLAGTAELVHEAERICGSGSDAPHTGLPPALWGATRRDRRRSALGVAGIVAGVLAIVGACMLPLPF